VIDKLWLLLPEIVTFAGAMIVAVAGLSRSRAVRDAGPLITIITLAVAAAMVPIVYGGERFERIASEGSLLLPQLGMFVKPVVCGIGILLALVNVGLVDRRYEAAVAQGHVAFDPIRSTRGEFQSFFLLSLMGVMLCCTANDLIWLFLALELTSLPTYVMVAMSRGSKKAQEAAVKYFFLGALAAAIFLYGFALLYGATGTLVLTEMRAVFAAQADAGGVSLLGIVGMMLAVLGVSFKIAAAPLHFYAPDVYEGAATPVTAFLAFVPKTAGMLALMALLSTVGWSGHYGLDAFGNDVSGLPRPLLSLLWVIAVLTMTIGNIAALLQTSVKRMLAYSSIAHSGYLVIGLIAGPTEHGFDAILFYLLAYGLMTTGAFAVVAALQRQGHEIERVDELAGLRQRSPWMAAAMAVCAGSLIGLPPLLGFWGKLYLFIAGVSAGQIALVVIAGVNSAISAWYYLVLVRQPILEQPSVQAEDVRPVPSVWPRVAGIVSAVLVVVLPIFTSTIGGMVEDAANGVASADVEASEALAGGSAPSGSEAVTAAPEPDSPAGRAG